MPELLEEEAGGCCGLRIDEEKPADEPGLDPGSEPLDPAGGNWPDWDAGQLLPDGGW